MAFPPSIFPATKELPDSLIGQTKIGYIAADTIQVNDAAVETICYIVRVSKVHPVNKQMEGSGVGDWQEERGMCWMRGK